MEEREKTKKVNSSRLLQEFSWIEEVKEATASYARDDVHLVGFSGGLDSRVLLHLLLFLGFKRLVICHLDHNLRGEESSGDRRFVQELSRQLDLPCYLEKLERLPEAGSLEASARQARWEFFTRVARQVNTQTIFLGHHADDQIETFLFNLFRGTASFDHAAIKPEANIRLDEINLLLVRPLLRISKDQLRQFALKLQLQYREDSTNASRAMTRNRIRHDLIPAIEISLGRSIRGAILRTIEIAAAEAEFLRSHLPSIDDQPTIRTEELGRLPLALQRLVIHSWLKKQKVSLFGFDEVERVRDLLIKKRTAKVNLPGGAFCRRRAGILFLEQPKPGGKILK